MVGAPQRAFVVATKVSCACPQEPLSPYGGGNKLGHLLGVSFKKDPQTPLISSLNLAEFKPDRRDLQRITPPLTVLKGRTASPLVPGGKQVYNQEYHFP